MRQFTTREYLHIAIANTLGMDKCNWDERLKFNKANVDPQLIKEPNLFRKAKQALKDYRLGNPSGFAMALDATASGLQIMACLIGCPKTAERVNLINTGNREDAYQHVADVIGMPRNIVKKPVMTHYYGSLAEPKNTFGDSEDLHNFYKTLANDFPGAEACMEVMQSIWQPNVTAHAWTLPDGHRAVCPVTEVQSIDVEVDDIKFGYRAEVPVLKKIGISLAANIVHSYDGWVVREMVRRAADQGFELLTIHDSFWSRPQYMNQVRQNYIDILMDLADMNCLQDVVREITGNHKLKINKFSNNLSSLMVDAEYALS